MNPSQYFVAIDSEPLGKLRGRDTSIEVHLLKTLKDCASRKIQAVVLPFQAVTKVNEKSLQLIHIQRTAASGEANGVSTVDAKSLKHYF